MKKFLPVVLSLFILLAVPGCTGRDSTASDGKIKVSATFNAVEEFVKAVGGNKADVTTIIPDGTEPHDFEPKAKDIANISKSEIFVYSGLGMETWAGKAVKSSGNGDITVVNASKGVTPIKSSDEGKTSENVQEDPHVWVSIKGAETELKNIRDAFIKVDPSHKEYYNENYSSFVSQLDKIYTEYKTKFKSLKNKSFVTGHAAFAYLCRDFGLKQESVEDVFAEGEPSAKKLTQLADYCRKNNVKTIFVENMVSPAVSKTLAKQVGAKVETIYTFESSEDNMSYIARMKSNLSKIYSSMK